LLRVGGSAGAAYFSFQAPKQDPQNLRRLRNADFHKLKHKIKQRLIKFYS
jgi:hypothetical protein